jgi:L-ascorbate metabolism protein UlaG (beta-lactamase superfamily)
MKIKYLGHSSFLITSEQGTIIVTDPYNIGQGIKYSPINETADIVTISHGHGDHSNAGVVRGTPKVLKAEGNWQIKGVDIKGIPAYHDESQGSQRGKTTIFCFKVDGINVCHVGDLGQILTSAQIAEIGPVDVLMIPVGGFYTIDAKQASTVTRSLHAVITIPMHYKTPYADFPIAGVEDFLKGKVQVRKMNSGELVLNKKEMPEKEEIVVLQPSN